jgi:chromosome segregation ATPase
VSNTSTTFPDAEFGWQGDRVGLGYDASLVTLTCPTYGRMFLGGFHCPCDPVSLPRLQKTVLAAEERLGLYPRRRTELVKQRLAQLEQTIAQRKRWLSVQVDKVKALQTQLAALPNAVSRLETKTIVLEAAYREQGRAEEPHSRLAKARRRLASARDKLTRAPQALCRAQQAAATHHARLADLRTERDQLTAHLTRLQNDNAQSNDPVRIIVRMDNA